MIEDIERCGLPDAFIVGAKIAVVGLVGVGFVLGLICARAFRR
jgi:hypothetical protein